MRNISVLVGVVAFLILVPETASACRCPEHASATTCYKKAQLVIIGKVLEVQANPGGDQTTATLTVDRAWKADVPKTISISTSTTCAFNFTQGTEYLLYLFRTPNGGYYTSKCVGNLPVREAASRLKWLQQHASVASTTGP
jgi:hypothetical protein